MRVSTAYFIGAGTVVVAIAAGLGGGLLLGNIMSPQQPKYPSSEVTRLEQRASQQPIQAMNGATQPGLARVSRTSSSTKGLRTASTVRPISSTSSEALPKSGATQTQVRVGRYSVLRPLSRPPAAGVAASHR